MGRWVYSTVDYVFESDSFETKEEAINSAKFHLDSDDCAGFYVGRSIYIAPHIDVEHAIEQVVEHLHGEVGDVADDYLGSLSKKEVNDLDEMINKTFNDWLTKYNNHPTFYKADDIEYFKLKDDE